MDESTAIQLVAVQMKMDLDAYWSRDAFQRRIDDVMERVSRLIDPSLPTLVAFPEDVGLMLVLLGMQRRLGRVRHIAEGIQKAIRSLFVPALFARVRHRLAWVPALFWTRHAQIASVYFDVFAQAAKTYNVYLVAGSAVLPPYRLIDGQVRWQEGPIRARLYNTSYLFGPDGSVLGRQAKVHLIDLEQEAALNLDQGSRDEIRTIETPIGRIGIAICLDSFEEDVVDALKDGGADILVQPSANPGPWSAEQQLDWLNSSYKRTFVEKKFAYAVNPMMTGAIWDLEFFGQSSIVARDETQALDSLGYADLEPMKGFLALAGDDTSEEILVARVAHPQTLSRPGYSSTTSTSPS